MSALFLFLILIFPAQSVNASEVDTKTLTFWSSGHQVFATEEKIEVLTNDGVLIKEIDPILSEIMSIKKEGHAPIKQIVAEDQKTQLYFNRQSVEDSLGGVAIFEFDNRGRRVMVSDPRGLKTHSKYNESGLITYENSPSTGITSRIYNNDDLKVLESHANGIVTSYQYDDQNRLKKVTYRDDDKEKKRFKYIYDDCDNGEGRLCTIKSKDGVIKYEYNESGRLAKSKTRLRDSKKTAITKYQYNSYNRIQQLTYPDGLTVFYHYDSSMKVSRITASLGERSFTIAKDIKWAIDTNQLSSITWGNGLVSSYDYNQDGQLDRLSTDQVQKLQYYHHPKTKDLTYIKDLLNEHHDQHFTYDLLNRLKSESHLGSIIEYSYDGVGNRLSRKTSPDEKIIHYQYGESSNQLIGINKQNLIYDENGNLLEDRNGKRRFEYDATNRLTSYYKKGKLKATYVYNALGQRIGKTRMRKFNQDDSRTTIYTYLPEGWLINENESGLNDAKVVSRNYVWLEGRPLAQIETLYHRNEVQVYYLHTDQLNTPRLATNNEQQVVWRWDSDTFGRGRAQQDPDNDGKKVAINLRFSGQYYDRESGLHYNHHRDYDPNLGRYIQSDPIGLKGGLNTYIYANNNPLRYIDPTGEFALIIPLLPSATNLIGGVVVAAVGGACLVLSLENDFNDEDLDSDDLSEKIGDISDKTGLTPKQVKDAIHKAKEYMPRNGESRNPDVFVDTKTGEVYPKRPNGTMGDSIGNIFD